MDMKFFRAILNKTKNRIKNVNIRLELGVDEIKKWHSKEQIKMVWTCDTGERREDIYKNWGKMTKRKTQNQMDRPN